MQRWTALLFFGLVVLAAVLVVTTKPAGRPLPTASAEASASGMPAALAPNGGVVVVANTSMAAPAVTANLDLDAGALPPITDEPSENADAGATLSDGTPAPQLGASAPKSVQFGVILVQYKGAQGAPRDARSKEDAQALAATIAQEAKDDFAAAARKADVGVEQAGSMVRGVLESGPEYTLFSLEVGAVSAPVDSPRGFYVFKRLE